MADKYEGCNAPNQEDVFADGLEPLEFLPEDPSETGVQYDPFSEEEDADAGDASEEEMPAEEEAEAADAEEPPHRLSLEERLRLIAERPNDLTFLFGTCDQEMLKLISIIAPALAMRGAANGYEYVNPAVSLGRALRGKTTADFDGDTLDEAIAATEWLADAWEHRGSASPIEIIRNLVVREILRDSTLRFLVLTRVESYLNTVRSVYKAAGIDLRNTAN